MDAGTIRDALRCGRPGCSCRGTRANVHCPAHDDADPSLSIAERDKKVLMKCRAGCPQEAVIGALRERGLWPEVRDKRQIVAAYDYGDFEVVRFQPKSFAQRRKDGQWGLGKLEPHLYRREEVLAAPKDAKVYLPEGEKDVDNLRSLGLVATTNPMGALKWRNAYSEDLVGRDVVILADADDAGRRHSRQVAQSIYKVASSVKVVELPGPGKDISDWLAGGHTAQELLALVEAAPLWAPPSEQFADGTAPVQVRRIADVAPEAVTWLWHPYIPLGKLTLLEGDPGVGKSWVSLAIATAVSLGRGLPSQPLGVAGNVLLASAEDGLGDTIRPRLDAMGADVSRIYALDGPLTLDDAGLVSLEDAIVKYQPFLVVLDPLVAYLGGALDIHRSNEVRHVMAALARLSETHGLAALAIRHLTKSEASKPIYRGLGSIDFTASCRSVLLAGCNPEAPQERGLVHIKSNLAVTGPSVGYELRDGAFYWTGESALTAADILAADDGAGASPLEAATAFLQEALAEGPVPAAQVWEAARDAGLKDRTVNRAKAKLGIVTRRQGETGKKGGGRYTWQLPDHLEGHGGLDCQDCQVEKVGNVNHPEAEIGVGVPTLGPLNGEEGPKRAEGPAPSPAKGPWEAEL